MTYQQIIEHYKSARNAADKLGYSVRALQYWQHRGVPDRAQKLIQAQTRGKLKA